MLPFAPEELHRLPLPLPHQQRPPHGKPGLAFLECRPRILSSVLALTVVHDMHRYTAVRGIDKGCKISALFVQGMPGEEQLALRLRVRAPRKTSAVGWPQSLPEPGTLVARLGGRHGFNS